MVKCEMLAHTHTHTQRILGYEKKLAIELKFCAYMMFEAYF